MIVRNYFFFWFFHFVLYKCPTLLNDDDDYNFNFHAHALYIIDDGFENEFFSSAF